MEMLDIVEKASERRKNLLEEFTHAERMTMTQFARLKGVTVARMSQLLKRAQADAGCWENPMERETYKPGDLPPNGYLAWHEWADVQRRAGIGQLQCSKCGLWRTPQELSANGQAAPVCSKCAANELEEK